MQFFNKISFVILVMFVLLGTNIFALERDGKEPSSVKVEDVNVSQTTNITVCYNERNNVSVGLVIENLGSDTITNLQLGWFLASDQMGSASWNGVLPPNGSQVVSLTNVHFATGGNFTLKTWAHLSSNDINSLNDTVLVNVIVDPPFNLDVIADTTVCKNQGINYSLPSGYSSYNWSTGQFGKNQLISSSGNYRVTVTNALGCSAVDSMYLGVYQSPDALLPDDTILCVGEILEPPVSPKFVSYQWLGGDTISDILIENQGDYVLSVLDTAGCTYVDTLSVLFAAPPVPTVPTQVFICDGDSALISVSNSFNSYQWSTGATGNSISTTSPGIYYITVTGPNGCFGFDTVQVLVNPLPNILFSDSLMCNNHPFVMDIGWFSDINWSNGDTVQSTVIYATGSYAVSVEDQNGCHNSDTVNVVNQSVVLDLGPDTSICRQDGYNRILSGYDSYLWSNGSTNPVHDLSAGGLYSVTVSENGCFVSDDIIVTSVKQPSASYVYDVSNTTVEFTNLSNSATTTVWDFNDGNISSVIDPIHTFSSFGVYDVTLTSQNMCDTISTVQSIGIFPVATPNIIVEDDFKIYPGLATNHINLQLGLNDLNEVHYMIYDAVGKLVVSNYIYQPQVDQVYKVDVTSFADGVYFFKVADAKGLIGVKQFLKQ